MACEARSTAKKTERCRDGRHWCQSTIMVDNSMGAVAFGRMTLATGVIPHTPPREDNNIEPSMLLQIHKANVARFKAKENLKAVSYSC